MPVMGSTRLQLEMTQPNLLTNPFSQRKVDRLFLKVEQEFGLQLVLLEVIAKDSTPFTAEGSGKPQVNQQNARWGDTV